MNGHHSHAMLYFSSLVLLLLFVAGNLYGIEQFWGFNFLKFLPSYWTYLFLAVTVILMLPIASKRLLSACDSFSHGLMANKARRIKFVVICSMLLLPLFLYFSSATTLLGDGSLRKNQIYAGQLWLPTEVLDFFAHAVLYKFVFRPFGLSIVDCYHAVSALCGVAFVAGSFRLAHYLNPRQSLVTFLLMLSSGVTVLFFGYVESYSILAGLLPYLVMSALNVVDGRIGRIRFILWYLIAALLHSASVALFSGALAIVLMLRQGEDYRRAKSVSTYLTAITLVLLAAAYIGRAAGVGEIGRYLLAPFPEASYRQGIFTVNHWLNLLNWLFLSALPFLFVSAFFIVKRRVTNHAFTRRSWYAVWIIIPSLLFMFFFVPQLGGPRDWDLFSLPAFLLIPSALIIYFARHSRTLPHQVMPVIFISACTTMAFGTVNSSIEKSTDRFVEIIEISKFKNLTKEYVTLLGAAEYHPEIKHRRLPFALKVWEQPPYTRKDSLLVLNKLGQIYTERGEGAKALHYLKLALSTDTTDLNSHLNLIQRYERFGTWEDLRTVAKMLERRFPDKARALVEAGITFQQVGEVERGGQNLERAFDLDSIDFFVLLNYSIFQIQIENYDRSIELLRRLLAMNPESVPANYYIALAYARLGEMAKAREYLSRTESLAKNSSEKQMLEDLKRKVGLPK